MAFHPNYKPTYDNCAPCEILTYEETKVLDFLRTNFMLAYTARSACTEMNMLLGRSIPLKYIDEALKSLLQKDLVYTIMNGRSTQYMVMTDDVRRDRDFRDDEDAKYAPIENRLEELGIEAMPYTGQILISVEEMTKLLALIP